MFNWLRDYVPTAVAWQLTPGHLAIHWYGIMYLVAITAAAGLIFFRHRQYFFNWTKEQLLDFILLLFLVGLLGARLYEVLVVDPVYYFANPLAILKVWQGGLAIHGGIIAGVLLACWKVGKSRFLSLADWFSPALLLAQGIGRWGNWFNQELFGPPTNKPWGIPINLPLRPTGYESFDYFHPAFLYEFLWNILGVALLIILERPLRRLGEGLLFTAYLFWYSLGRFLIEFWRLDPTPLVVGWRWPQLFSLLLMAVSIAVAVIIIRKRKPSS